MFLGYALGLYVVSRMHSLEDLRRMVLQVKERELRKCLESFIENPRLSVAPSAEPKISLEESPAAPRKHHMYRGGLVHHTIAVTMTAIRMAEILKRVYELELDVDLVIAASILHDLYKYYQYEYSELDGCYKPRVDWYFSHDYAIVAEASKRGCPEKLLRVLSEVHGTVPISTIEGLVVHLADSVDAKIGEYLQSRVLSVLKELEAEYGCKHTRLFQELVSRFGLGALADMAFKGALKEVARSVCMELKG